MTNESNLAEKIANKIAVADFNFVNEAEFRTPIASLKGDSYEK